jgi:hypothetical protein
MVAPKYCLNLQRLVAEGWKENMASMKRSATPRRVCAWAIKRRNRSFMAHHEGMTLPLAIFLDRPMPGVRSDPMFQATTLLLGTGSKASAFYWHAVGTRNTYDSAVGAPVAFQHPDTPIRGTLLSNGRYHVMITNAGGGYSRWKSNYSHTLARTAPATTGHLLLPPRRDERGVLVNRIPANAQTIGGYEAISQARASSAPGPHSTRIR